MSSINVVVLTGRVSRDIELKMVASSKGEIACARLTVAIAPSIKKVDTRTTEQKAQNVKFDDGTCFVDVTLWGKLAETAQKYLSVGRMVGIEGELYISSFVDKDTAKNRTLLKVKATSLKFLDNKKASNTEVEEPDFDAPVEQVVETPTVNEAPATEKKTRTRKTK